MNSDVAAQISAEINFEHFTIHLRLMIFTQKEERNYNQLEVLQNLRHIN